MNTDHEFHLMQLADSFFPSGIFGMSSGLESSVRHGRVQNGNDILRFIKQQIKFQIVPCECTFLLITMDAVYNNEIEKLIDIDNRFYSMKLIKEIRNASVRSGSQMLNCILYMISADKRNLGIKFQKKIKSKETPGTYPICLGIAASCLDIPKQSAIRMILYSYCQSVVGAAIRLGVIEHLSGQKILTQLKDDINKLSASIKTKSINNIWQLTPLTDILQMRHEHDDSKMFIT